MLTGSSPAPSPLCQPCQPLDHQSQDILDKLILCGLLEAEEVGVPALLRDLRSWSGTRDWGTCPLLPLGWEGPPRAGVRGQGCTVPFTGARCHCAVRERALAVRPGPTALQQGAALDRGGFHRQ